MRGRLVAVACLLLSATPASASPTCDPSVKPAGPDGYGPRGGTRCEGLFVSRVSGPALELVSFTYGAFPPGRAELAEFALRAPGAARESSAWQAHAMGIPLGLYYRMDADMAPSEALIWPSGEVLGKEHIRLDQIGVYGTVGGGGGGLAYTPVLVARRSDAPAGGPAPHAVRLTLRPLTLLDKAAWRFVPEGQAATPWQQTVADGDRIVIDLPVLAAGGRGALQVEWADPDTGSARFRYFQLRF